MLELALALFVLSFAAGALFFRPRRTRFENEGFYRFPKKRGVYYPFRANHPGIRPRPFQRSETKENDSLRPAA